MEARIETIISEIETLQQKAQAAAQNRAKGQPVDRRHFTLLLGGVSVCLRTPGIPVHMGYDKLYHCEGEQDAAQVRHFLEQMYRITDGKSLQENIERIFGSSEQYGDFMTFWCGAPLFDLKELNRGGKKVFLACRECAEPFRPIVKEKGFYAWDIDSRIGLCRRAVACGILSEEDFWEITDPWVREALVFYHSFEEYAVSILCGVVYDVAVHGRKTGRIDKDVAEIFENHKNMVEHLLGEGGAWCRNAWYEPKEREWAAPLMRGGYMGCKVTQKALEEGAGHMCRLEPEKGNEDIDSGWRFFAEDETQECTDRQDSATIMSLDSVCNLWPEMMGFLHAGTGRKFAKTKNGWAEE